MSALAPPPPSPDIELLRTLLSDRAGIDFGRHRRTFLESRILRRMTLAGARSVYEYYRMVADPGAGRGELQALVDELSINETSFFRNEPQFQMLQQLVFPERMTVRLQSARRQLRVWSAGCSTGQEVYSIAITFFESLVLPDTWDVRLVASDISVEALRQAKAGRYTLDQMDGISDERRRRFFERKGDAFSVRSWVRRHLDFCHGSLLGPAPDMDFDVIFCRNVMIYFDQSRQRELVEILSRSLAPEGYLFLGHTESLGGLSDRFQMVSAGRGIAYRKLP